jgi:hypothetical protein
MYQIGKDKKCSNVSWAWWLISVIPALWRCGQEDHEFEANLGYIVRLCLNNNNNNNKKV